MKWRGELAAVLALELALELEDRLLLAAAQESSMKVPLLLLLLLLQLLSEDCLPLLV